MGVQRASCQWRRRVPGAKTIFPTSMRARWLSGGLGRDYGAKYDCQPASSPAIQYDPYAMQVTQWPDRVLFRYEKDDQLRTVWLDGREPKATDFSLQGFSVGHYEDGSLYVTTTHFVFDIAGFDDYNGIPSSAQKVVTERYWRKDEELKLTLTVADPMFLQEPTSYTTRWLPRPGLSIAALCCDPEASRHLSALSFQIRLIFNGRGQPVPT